MASTPRETPKHDTVMDVTEEQIARVYAQAFLGVAIKAANMDGLIEEVTSLVTDVLDKFPRLEETLRTELISHEHKQGIFDRVFGQRASKQVLSFLKVLAIHNRLGLLRPIARILNKLYAVHRGLTDVDVRVARELDDTLRQAIHNHLKATLGTEPVLHVTVDPSLLAGMTIRVGDRVYDGSVQTQLNLARKAMIERAVDMIETQPERFMQV
jgi:F-type H+-transporting ATPase subunit delta